MAADESKIIPFTLSRNGNTPKRQYNMVDLFAGCGGLSLGFENAGFQPVFVNEINEDAKATYLANRHHSLGGMKFSENQALHCNDAHELNGKRLEQLVSDLSQVSGVELVFDTASATSGGGSNLDVLAGGPPCQGYSGIGIRRSYDVDKIDLPSNQLFQLMVSVIQRLRPRVFLFENVRGLLTSKWTRGGRDRIFPDILGEFRAIPGYEVRWSLVYAKDYGVPQNRPRVLLVGMRRDVLEACDFLDESADPEDALACGFLPTGRSGEFPDLQDLLGDLVDDSVSDVLRSGAFEKGSFKTTAYPRHACTPIQKSLRSTPEWYGARGVRLTEQEYSKHKPKVVKKFLHMIHTGGEIPEEMRTKKFSQRILKPHWGNQEPNITATSLPDDYVHFAQPRILTVREWARLQLFPDWYRFVGKRTTGGTRRAGKPTEGIFEREVPKYTQIGNAVPIGLAECVGKHFRSILDAALNN